MAKQALRLAVLACTRTVSAFPESLPKVPDVLYVSYIGGGTCRRKRTVVSPAFVSDSKVGARINP